MSDKTVRETKRADELKPGDWLLEDENGNQNPNEVMAVFEYPTACGPRMHLTTQVPGKNPVSCGDLWPNATFELVTQAELAVLREQAERAQFTAGLREFADWLDANPWAPFKRLSGYTGVARIQIDLHGGDMDATAETIGQVRGYAERMGVKVDESLDDRTDASIKIGSVEYSVIAWHKDGRPVEPAPEPEVQAFIDRMHDAADQFHKAFAADPTGLAYSRADEQDAPTPVSGARVEPHVGAVTDEGLVDETPDTKPLPNCLPGCRRTDAECGPGSSSHAENCPELNCPECGRRHVPWCAS